MLSEELIVHFPILALITGAIGRLVGLEGLLVDGPQGQVTEDVSELSRVDVISLDLGQRHTDVAGAVVSLVVGEINQGERRVFFPFERVIVDVENHLLKGVRRPWPTHRTFHGV